METEQKEKETPEEWKSQQKRGDLVRMYNECKIIHTRKSLFWSKVQVRIGTYGLFLQPTYLIKSCLECQTGLKYIFGLIVL